MEFNFERLTGRASDHLETFSLQEREFQAHPEAWKALMKFFTAARDAGFDPHLVSSFRSFEQQKAIWQRKYRGERALLNDRGEPLNFESMNEEEIILAIMRWSAVPGASRHHWGTDFDVVDFSGGKVEFELTPGEFEGSGPFANFGAWIENQMMKGLSHGFYRPYREDLGGVGKEPWHLSFSPIALDLEQEYTIEVFEKNLALAQLGGNEYLVKEARTLYRQFVANISG